MWEWIVIPMLTMAIGFLIGFMVGDGSSENMQIDDLRKEQRKLRREIMKLKNE